MLWEWRKQFWLLYSTRTHLLEESNWLTLTGPKTKIPHLLWFKYKMCLHKLVCLKLGLMVLSPRGGCGGGVWLQEVGGWRWALRFIAKDHFLYSLCSLVHHYVKSHPWALAARPSCPRWAVPSNGSRNKSLTLFLIRYLVTATSVHQSSPQLLANQVCDAVGEPQELGALCEVASLPPEPTFIYIFYVCVFTHMILT